jgi:transcriptional regulator with XRE-family HTH domain
MDLKIRLKENLKFLFYKLDTYPAEIARIAGIPRQNLSDWQGGLIPRDPVKVKRVAEALGVSLDDLFFAEMKGGE